MVERVKSKTIQRVVATAYANLAAIAIQRAQKRAGDDNFDAAQIAMDAAEAWLEWAGGAAAQRRF